MPSNNLSDKLAKLQKTITLLQEQLNNIQHTQHEHARILKEQELVISYLMDKDNA